MVVLVLNIKDVSKRLTFFFGPAKIKFLIKLVLILFFLFLKFLLIIFQLSTINFIKILLK